MKNELLDRGIITPSGEISKDKINLAAGAVTQPFAEMVWVTTGGDMETINRLTDILVTMNTTADRGKLFKIIKMLYGLMGLLFSEEAEPTRTAHAASACRGESAGAGFPFQGGAPPFPVRTSGRKEPGRPKRRRRRL